MPELPEVETTRAGLAPHVEGRRVRDVLLRRPDLRWPIPPEVAALLPGQRIDAVRRRAKYLLLDTAAGSALLHLGMSGSLRVLEADTPPRAHDHVDVLLDSGRVLRFNDPRRFGCLLWQPAGEVHPLLRGLGPEPLSHDFDGDYLFARSRGRSAPVKAFLMDQRIVVGVGKLPQLASSMGRMRAEFKRGMVEGTPVDITPRAGAEPAAASPGRKPGHPDNKVEEATFDEPSSPR